MCTNFKYTKLKKIKKERKSLDPRVYNCLFCWILEPHPFGTSWHPHHHFVFKKPKYMGYIYHMIDDKYINKQI